MPDFDGSANALWTLYGKEAKSNDEAQIQSLKDDMDGVLIFVRSLFPHAYKSLTHGRVGGFIFRCPYRIRN
jgi:hypothetical protein